MLELANMRLDLDPAAFFDEFHPRIFRFMASATGAPAADIDDLVQETLLHAWRNRAQFRGESSLLTWILAIARNRARMRLRSLGKRPEVRELVCIMDREDIPPCSLQSEEMAWAVRRGLDALDASQADLLLKRYYDGLSVRQIADLLGESSKTVESRLHRARLALRDRLINGVEDDV